MATGKSFSEALILASTNPQELLTKFTRNRKSISFRGRNLKFVRTLKHGNIFCNVLNFSFHKGHFCDFFPGDKNIKEKFKTLKKGQEHVMFNNKNPKILYLKVVGL